jgi:hypothetical protein
VASGERLARSLWINGNRFLAGNLLHENDHSSGHSEEGIEDR